MEAVAVIAGIVALIWAAVLFRRGGLMGGCLAVLLAGCCFGYQWFHLATEPIPLTVDRLLWGLLLVQYVLWRRFGWTQPKPWGKADLVLVAFFALLFVSTLTHDWQVERARPLSRLLFYWVMPLGMYWVARQMVVSQRGFAVLLGGLSVFGVYLSVTAIAETQQLWELVYPSYIASPEFPEFLGRGRGPFLNPIGCGLFQGVCLGALLLAWPRLGRWGRGLLLVLAAVLGVGIYDSLTRSVWMGAGLGLLILLGAVLPRRGRGPLLVGCLGLAVLLTTLRWDELVAFKRDQQLDAGAAAESVELRPILAMVAWKMFLDRPLLGCGFGQYPEESLAYTADRSGTLALEKGRRFVQHNTFLALLTETGLVGAGLFVLLLGFWTVEAWQLWQRTAAPLWARQQGLLFLVLLGNYLPNAMFHDLSLIAMVNMLLFFSAGVTTSLSAATKYASLDPALSAHDDTPPLQSVA